MKCNHCSQIAVITTTTIKNKSNEIVNDDLYNTFMIHKKCMMLIVLDYSFRVILNGN